MSAPSDDDKSVSKSLRRSIQAQMEAAEAERKRELFKRRLELARQGLAFYETKKIQEAVQNFHAYLKILEDGKKVSEGGLSPANFDREKDVRELLLISGVYWDLVKIYDRSKKASNIKEMMGYLDKYVLFSKGMPYQPVSAETLRKYITNEKAVNREAFKNAYKKLTDGKCFVATELAGEIEPLTLPRLRAFRDQRLNNSRLGKLLIRFYYLTGPLFAQVVRFWPAPARRSLAGILDRLARKLI